MSLLTESVPYEEAARIVADKQIMSKAAFDALCDELKARAFVVTGLEDLRAVQEIRDAIAELPRGAAWEDVKAQVVEKLEAGGFSQAAADYRAMLLLRHHGFAAYAQENYRELREMQDVFPYWKYQSMGDEKVRSSHAALDGLILPADDPFWKDHFPPWEWNCRCQVVGVTQEEYDGARTVGTFDASDPDAKASGWKLTPALHERLRQGQLDDGSGHPVMVTRTGSFHFDPSGPGLDMAEIEKRYNPGDWANFRERMEAEKLADGRSVWEWATGKKAAEIAKTHAPAEPETPRFTDSVVKGDPVCDALGCRKGAPFSIEDAAAIANPHFKEGPEFQNNCVRCVQAYELARRGYDVEALPAPMQRGEHDFTRQSILLGNEIFKTPGGGVLRISIYSTRGELEDSIQKAPIGARFSITVKQSETSGHIFCAERVDGGIRYIDPQNPKRDGQTMLSDCVQDCFMLLRMDNVDINPDKLSEAVKKG